MKCLCTESQFLFSVSCVNYFFAFLHVVGELTHIACENEQQETCYTPLLSILLI